jgi:membrane-associated phospholipid phosphatase
MLKIPVSRYEMQMTYRIARAWSTPRLDPLMVAVSNPYRWLAPSVLIVMALIYHDWQSALKAIFLGGLGAAIADGINTKVIKKRTDRIRPGKQFEDIRSLGIMNRGKKSFPSNHASNTMAFAAGLALVYPGVGMITIPLSLLVGYSRIYCGAHFPLDVLFGFLHGLFWVLVSYLLWNWMI